MFVAPAGRAQVAGEDPYDSLPRQYWDYMEGYRYQYTDSCTVGWHVRSATFTVPESCPELSMDKLRSDALKSIEYARSKSTADNFLQYYERLEGRAKPRAHYGRENAKADAKEIWRRACLDAKELKPANPNHLIDSYPGVDRMHALRLLQNARQTVTGLGGMVNCAEQAHYAVEMYASDIDIRSKGK